MSFEYVYAKLAAVLDADSNLKKTASTTTNLCDFF